MKKHFYITALFMSLLLLKVMAQSDKLPAEDPVKLTEKLDGLVTLYLINDKSYVGDSTCTIINEIDKSKVQIIYVVTEEKEKKVYLNRAGKYSDKIKQIVVIWTTKEDDFKYDK